MIIALLLLAYLTGSIPFGLLLTRMAGLGDIRNIGSGNIGATNVMRTGHKGLGAATLLLDGGKGWLAVWLAMHYSNATDNGNILLLAPIAVVCGHIFPVWLRFKGGKGVATAFGAAIALSPLTGVAGLAVWLCTFGLTRISSVSALAAIGALPFIALYLTGAGMAFWSLIVIAFLVYWRHKENIRRLLSGTEFNFRGGRS